MNSENLSMDGPLEDKENTNSEKLNDDSQIPNGIHESDKSVKVFDDDVSPSEKPKDDPITESGNAPSSVGVTKGKGLRKWKRIKRREFVKEGTGSVDSNKPVKRGLSTSALNPIRGQKSEGSLSSTGAVVKKLENQANSSTVDPKLVDAEPADSENSISSTAASGSVVRNGGPARMAVMSEKKGVNGVKQPVKSKKARGERQIIEKENSISSSLESDSRSSNFVFVQGTDSVSYNGSRSGKVNDHGGQNSDDEAQNGEKHIIDEVGAGISKENGGEADNLADVENVTSGSELDPLAESILKLQSAQEALEKEIQKLREIGNESQGITEDNIHEGSSSGLFNVKENAEIFPNYHFKTHVNTQKRNVDVSENKLEDANAAVKAEESEEIEAEIENLFKHKIEAEFKYLAISRALENYKIDVVDQLALSDELKTTLDVMRNVENNVNMLKRQADKLESRVEETIETEQVPELRKRVCQVTSCLFIQLILLFSVFVAFDLHSYPHNAGVVPT